MYLQLLKEEFISHENTIDKITLEFCEKYFNKIDNKLLKKFKLKIKSEISKIKNRNGKIRLRRYFPTYLFCLR